MKRSLLLVFLLALVTGGYYVYANYASGLYYMAGQYDRMMNPYGVDPDAPTPGDDDRALHQSMFIADMHADTLKWERNLLERSYFGHADLPRLAEGNVSLQGFTIVTKSPLRMPWSTNVSGRSIDTNTLLSLMQGRPAFDLRARAFYQIDRFKEAVEESRDHPGAELRLLETFDDLRQLVADRRDGDNVIGGFIGIEGGHWIGGPDAEHADVEADIQELFDAGVRMFAPSHRFDNNLSGSSEGYDRYGLTSHGMTALATAARLGMLVDVAHISPAGLRDTANLVDQPITNSHTGIRTGCEEPCRPDRNLSDDDIRYIIANDGVISVGYWPQAVGPSVWRIADVMAHIMLIADEMGVDDPSRHVAFGSDYDGSVTPMIEVSHLDVLTTIMRQREEPFSEHQIRNIAGGNTCRVLATVLPGGSPDAAEELCRELAVAEPLQPPTASTDGAPIATASLPPVTSVSDLVGRVARAQSELNHWLRAHLNAVQGEGLVGTLLVVLIGFVYGLLHSAGPGHGKIVVASYFMANPTRPGRAIALSALMAMMQATTAILVVGGLFLLANQAMVRVLDQAAAIEAIAYMLVIGLGAMMLLRGMRGAPACGQCAAGHHHHHAKDDAAHRFTMIMAIGLRPCSGALALLLFTVALGLFPTGVLATLAMGVGTAITVSVSAVAAISIRGVLRDSVARMAGGERVNRLGPVAARGLQCLAGGMIAATGALFLAVAVLKMGVL
nr:membrane dipeptidase [Natronocella acetinitrilica]